MGKPTIVVFWVAGLVFTAVSFILALQIPQQELQAPATLQSPVIIPGVLIFIAGVANFVAWVGALVLAGRIGAWGWFVGVLLLGTLGLLGFLVFGPNLMDEYSDFGDFGDFGSPV